MAIGLKMNVKCFWDPKSIFSSKDVNFGFTCKQRKKRKVTLLRMSTNLPKIFHKMRLSELNMLLSLASVKILKSAFPKFMRVMITKKLAILFSLSQVKWKIRFWCCLKDKEMRKIKKLKLNWSSQKRGLKLLDLSQMRKFMQSSVMRFGFYVNLFKE